MDSIKFPITWLKQWETLSEEEVGRIVFCIFEYAEIGSYTDCRLGREATVVLNQCLADVDYQIIHKKSCKKPDSNKGIRNSEEYKVWRAAVYARDQYTCQNCGQVGGNIQAHHIKSFAKHPDLRLVVGNGVTLCKECHKLAHRKKVLR